MMFSLRFVAGRTTSFRPLPASPSRPAPTRLIPWAYKAKQGYVVYSGCIRHGGRKKPVLKGIVHGKPTNQGVTQLKFQCSSRSVAEERAGRQLCGLRVLNSDWINRIQVPTHNAIRTDPRINLVCQPVHKHRELRGLTSAGKIYRCLCGKELLHHKARQSRRATWKRNQTLSLRLYC